MSNDSILVLGDGLLGGEIARQANWPVLSRSKDAFDIVDPACLRMMTDDAGSCRYDVIVNCIANTDTYSDDRDAHWGPNYSGVANLVEFCNEQQVKLVQISTDYLYTGSASNAAEGDVPVHGNNWYCYTKLLADGYVQLRSNDYLLIRCTHKPTPFPYERAWTDQTGNFDYVDTIGGLIIQLIKKGSSGVFNVGTEQKSIHDLAVLTNPSVLSTHRPPGAPGDVTMDVSKLKDELGL
jgi:dTDP-4-dehydrorhamnose reductase